MDVRPRPESEIRRMKNAAEITLGAVFGLLVSACAGPRAVIQTDWLPPAKGWDVRDVDDNEPMRWVVYQRDALAADVKEIRIVGVVDAEPPAVAEALRKRLLDDTLLPDNVQRTLLKETRAEIEFYGLSSLPFPFDDREVNELLTFSHDASTGIHTIDVRNIDPDTPEKPGIVRIPVVRNKFVIAPAGRGRSAVIMDSVHDLGGNFPNWAIYGPIADHLVLELVALNELTAHNQRHSQSPKRP